MFFLLTLALGSLAFIGVQGSAIPSVSRDDNQVAARDGPSGYVVYPPGGDTNINAGGNDPNSAGVPRRIRDLADTVFAETIGIDVYLEDPAGVQADMPMAYDFGNPVAGSMIEGYFVPPTGACGTYRLVFIEHQYQYGHTVVAFRAAAPTVAIECTPLYK